MVRKIIKILFYLIAHFIRVYHRCSKSLKEHLLFFSFHCSIFNGWKKNKEMNHIADYCLLVGSVFFLLEDA